MCDPRRPLDYLLENAPRILSVACERVWNAAKVSNYKGGLIVEKATGKSVSPPAEIEPESPDWESEEEEEGG